MESLYRKLKKSKCYIPHHGARCSWAEEMRRDEGHNRYYRPHLKLQTSKEIEDGLQT